MNSLGIVRKSRLGDDVSTYCGRCKEEREHQVVALNSSHIPEKVTCRTCGSEHIYRSPKTTAARKTTVRKERQSSTKFDTAISAAEARAYSPQERYDVGSAVSHPRFGLGR